MQPKPEKQACVWFVTCGRFGKGMSAVARKGNISTLPGQDIDSTTAEKTKYKAGHLTVYNFSLQDVFIWP